MDKTACTHIASLLSKHIGGQQIGLNYQKHNWLSDYETKKYICGSIRNPWEWYVSTWAFGCQGEGTIHNRVIIPDFQKFLEFFKHKLLSDYNPFSFNNVQLGDTWLHFKNEIKKPVILWRDTYKDYQKPEKFRKWLKLIYDPERKRDFNEGYSESSVSNYAGLMTYLYCNFFIKNFFQTKNFRGLKTFEELREFDKKNNILNFTIKVESLENDFIQMLEKFGYKIDVKTKNLILNSGRTNTSEHLKPSFYYDEETINLVAEKEKLIIEKYRYTPPEISSKTQNAGSGIRTRVIGLGSQYHNH